MDIKSLADSELMILRLEIEKEMISRSLPFSVGEFGEKEVIKHFNNTPGLPNLLAAPPGAKNVDAISREGDRYSIKSVLKAKKTGTIYPDTQNPNKQLFEFILVVMLSPEFQLDAIYRLSWDQFTNARAWDKRMNAWYIPVSRTRLNSTECIYKRD